MRVTTLVAGDVGLPAGLELGTTTVPAEDGWVWCAAPHVRATAAVLEELVRLARAAPEPVEAIAPLVAIAGSRRMHAAHRPLPHVGPLESTLGAAAVGGVPLRAASTAWLLVRAAALARTGRPPEAPARAWTAAAFAAGTVWLAPAARCIAAPRAPRPDELARLVLAPGVGQADRLRVLRGALSSGRGATRR